MLCSPDRPDFRQKAAETIIKIRGLRQEGAGLRIFAPPEVNWETATSYDKFISEADFEDPQNLNEPPVTMRTPSLPGICTVWFMLGNRRLKFMLTFFMMCSPERLWR